MTVPAAPEFLALQRAVAGRYSLEREIGRGGMGIVFLARDVALDRPVAIKLLPPNLAGIPDLRERFLREARTAAQLSHPNIVPIFLVEERDDLVYFVMAYVDGETLGQRVRRAGRLTPSDTQHLIRDVAWALAYAHGRGVVHRDIKPDNIMIDKGARRAMVTDFGIARVAQTGGLTGKGEIIGTAQYMSPEQAAGEAVDGRSDLYSLGGTAYFALTGTPPFEGDTLHAVISKQITQPAPRAAVARPGTPEAIAAAIDRCLAKAPQHRFPSAEALAEAVEAGAGQREVPPQIRHLLRMARDVDTSAGMLLLAALIFPPVAAALWESDRSTVVFLAALLGLQVVLPPIQVLHAVRHVLRAGFQWDHTRRAVEHAAQAAREEMEAVFGAKPEKAARTLHRGEIWRRLGLGSMGIGAVVLVAGSLTGTFDTVGPAGVALLVIGGIGWAGSVAVRASARSKEAPPMGLGNLILKSRIGKWLFRLAGIGLRTTDQNVSPAAERTEFLLAEAADALYDNLPSTVRERLPMVPDAIQRLESDAQALRDRERLLSRALAGSTEAPETVLREARDAVRERLGAAVAALENIRLDLIRLSAGEGSADDLTADLAEAASINKAVDAELAAQREVHDFLAGDTG